MERHIGVLARLIASRSSPHANLRAAIRNKYLAELEGSSFPIPWRSFKIPCSSLHEFPRRHWKGRSWTRCGVFWLTMALKNSPERYWPRSCAAVAGHGCLGSVRPDAF